MTTLNSFSCGSYLAKTGWAPGGILIILPLEQVTSYFKNTLTVLKTQPIKKHMWFVECTMVHNVYILYIIYWQRRRYQWGKKKSYSISNLIQSELWSPCLLPLQVIKQQQQYQFINTSSFVSCLQYSKAKISFFPALHLTPETSIWQHKSSRLDVAIHLCHCNFWLPVVKH